MRLSLKDKSKETPEVRAWLDEVGEIVSALTSNIHQTYLLMAVVAFTNVQTNNVQCVWHWQRTKPSANRVG